MTEPYHFYMPLLDDNRSKVLVVDRNGTRRFHVFHPNVAEVTAQEIVQEFAPDDAEVKKIVAKYPKTPDQIPHLKQWLQSRIEKSKD